jgi:RNA polymerase sigma-70 factor (ECF subfamily)
MASAKELSDFLISVERRAFKHAFYTTRDEDAALDIVQDSMIKLSEKYGDHPAAELPLLFQRILQNTTLDHLRRTKVRNRWTSLFSSFTQFDDSNEERDVLETLEIQDSVQLSESGETILAREQTLDLIEEELKNLPPRQRQAFLLRYWEDMNTKETAEIMECSEGSVKTHCSRATHTLAAALQKKGITL